jgi:hypothetical protein
MLTARDLVLVFLATFTAVSLALLLFFLTPIGATVLAVVVVLVAIGALVLYFARSARNSSGPPY